MPNGFPQLPAAPNPPASIESAIGTALADAAAAIGCGLQELADGGLTPATRTAGGDAIGWLATIEREVGGEIDFRATVRREGRIALTQRLATVGATADAATLDVILADVLALVGQVAFAN